VAPILVPPKWLLVTEDNAKQIFEYLKSKGVDPVLFAVTDEDYQLIAINHLKVRNFILINTNIINKYKDYYE
jgi:hypothetical protein